MLRAYRTSDKLQLIKLLQLNTPTYFAASEQEDFEEYLDKHSDNYYVIEVNEQIISCGGYNYDEDSTIGKLSWYIVHPNYQGKGYGKQIVQYCIKALKAQPSVKMISVRTSQLVYPFFEKLGFELKKVEKDYWAKGFDLYQMELKQDH